MKNGLRKKSLLLVIVLIMALSGVGIAHAVTVHILPQTKLSPWHGWVAVTQAQFEAGVINQTDTSSSPGNVTLGTTVTTTTYDFSTNASVDKWAWDAVGDKYDPPTAPTTDTEADSAQYTAIATSNDVWWEMSKITGNKYGWLKINMTIAENPASITRINFTGEAYGSVWSDVVKIYAYNITTPGWDLVTTGTLPGDAPDATITGSITSGFSNYIDGSGYLVWLFGMGQQNQKLFVDYVNVTVATSGAAYYSSGTIASEVYDTGNAGASWDWLGWNETVEESVTDITFEVRASDTLFAKTDATPTWQAASALPITGRYQQWRATLTTSDTSKTPILHEVRVLYSS